MLPGQRVTYEGSEVCLFPMDYINVTQTSGPSSLSHCCGQPIDLIGPYGTYPIYAPFSCHLVYRDNSGNTRAYTSDNPVWTPSGLTYVTFSVTHDNNPPTRTSFTQGELIAHTGTAGMVTGDHVHLDQSPMANARLVSYGITCAYGNLCYALQGSIIPTSIYYLTGGETIINTRGLQFQTWQDVPPTPTPPPVTVLLTPIILHYLKKKRNIIKRRM